MDIVERDGKHVIVHGGKTIKEKFKSEDDAWKWADRNIDDQMFDKPNTFSDPLVYDDDE
jgi:hypothetical protein